MEINFYYLFWIGNETIPLKHSKGSKRNEHWLPFWNWVYWGHEERVSYLTVCNNTFHLSVPWHLLVKDDAKVEMGPDPTRAYFWPAVNMRPTRLWPGHFPTRPEAIFFDPKGKKLKNLMFLGEIFQILAQTINGWPVPTRPGSKIFDPDPSLCEGLSSPVHIPVLQLTIWLRFLDKCGAIKKQVQFKLSRQVFFAWGKIFNFREHSSTPKPNLKNKINSQSDSMPRLWLGVFKFFLHL